MLRGPPGPEKFAFSFHFASSADVKKETVYFICGDTSPADLIKKAEDIARREKIEVHKGVYAAVSGPNLETAAEYRFLRTIGADVVGMSTIPEDIVAIHMGMKVLGLSVVTDACVPEQLQPANVPEIIRIAKNTEPKLTTLIKKVVEQL